MNTEAGRAVSSAALCDAAIEQAVWAEQHGFDAILIGEHHGTEDGYLPSPMMLASAVAARTRRICLKLGVLVRPFSNPLRVSEDICVLDNISQGRVDVSQCGFPPCNWTAPRTGFPAAP